MTNFLPGGIMTRGCKLINSKSDFVQPSKTMTLHKIKIPKNVHLLEVLCKIYCQRYLIHDII